MHALFFNYQPAVFLVIASKVAHLGVLAPTSYRRGPQLTKTCVWGAEKSVGSSKLPLKMVSPPSSARVVSCQGRH